MSDISYEWFVRKPFAVEATLITEENIDEIATRIGMGGTVRTRGDEKYIALDRRIVPNVGRAYIGWYLTQLGDNLRCYNPKTFQQQFFLMPEQLPVEIDFRYTDDSQTEMEPVIFTHPGGVVLESVDPVEV